MLRPVRLKLQNMFSSLYLINTLDLKEKICLINFWFIQPLKVFGEAAYNIRKENHDHHFFSSSNSSVDRSLSVIFFTRNTRRIFVDHNLFNSERIYQAGAFSSGALGPEKGC